MPDGFVPPTSRSLDEAHSGGGFGTERSGRGRGNEQTTHRPPCPSPARFCTRTTTLTRRSAYLSPKIGNRGGSHRPVRENSGAGRGPSEPRLRPRLALAGNRPTRHAPGNSVGRLVERHLMPLSNIGTWVAFAYAARDARCSSSQCSLIHPRFPSCTTGTLNRERIAAVVSPTKTPMMNHICSLAGTSPASRNPRRRQRRRRSLAESTGIATRRRSGLIRRLNVNLSCGNWPGVHSCCELVAQAVGPTSPLILLGSRRWRASLVSLFMWCVPSFVEPALTPRTCHPSLRRHRCAPGWRWALPQGSPR